MDRGNVRNALIWLKLNNRYYQDIEISESNLNDLPDQGSIYAELVNTQARQNDSLLNEEELDRPETNEGGNQDLIAAPVMRSGVADLSSIDQRTILQDILGFQLSDNDLPAAVLQWPNIDTTPINEFTTQGYIACAFPTLFPFGRADLRTPRIKKVDPNPYFKHLMKYKDGRFATHPTFRFFAMNSLLRWMAFSNATICIRKNPELQRLDSPNAIRDYIQRNPQALRQILAFNKNIRSTSAYWFQRSRELLRMIQQIGTPTLFLTFSAADLHWKKLHNLLDPTQRIRGNPRRVAQQRAQMISDNPMISCYFFTKRLESFLKQVLFPKFDVIDHWHRIEFQHRGSPHMHGVFWLKNSPNVNVEAIEREMLQEIRIFFDTIITAYFPRPPGFYQIHPCTLDYSEVVNLETDYNQLIHATIEHKHQENYCIKRDRRTGQHVCRFKFPRPLLNESTIQFQNNQLVYTPARNHPMVNTHNKSILQIWRGNIDVQPITSNHVVANYIAKYASKGESRSRDLNDILQKSINTIQGSATVRQAVQKILCQMCGDRDYSSQESVQVLMGWEFFRSSRTFITISLSNEEWEFVHVENETIQRQTSIVDKYASRPLEYEQLSLLDFTSNYYKRGQTFSKRNKPAVIQVIPYLEYVEEGNNEHYFRIECLLRIPWRNSAEMRGYLETWESLYYESEVLAQHRHQLNLEQLVEENEDDLEDIDEFEDGIIRDQEWMEAAGMGRIEDSGEVMLGERDIDLNNDWMSSWDLFPNAETFPEFIKEMKRQDQGNLEERTYNYPNVSFSLEQQRVIEMLDQQIQFIKRGGVTPPQVTIVQGKAGSGKSTLIQHMTAKLSDEFGIHSFALLAPTGAAAINISGSTIHSKLRIRPKQVDQLPLTNFTLNSFQQEFAACKFIIIDEYSMLGCRILKFIDQRCREATGKSRKRFGGMFVFMLGDLKQLPPVKDRPMYSSSWGRATIYFEGQRIFTEITSFIFLNNSYRPAEASQQLFRDILDRIGSGDSTVEDWRILMSRVLDQLPENERQSFATAIRLFSTNEEVRRFNQHQLEILAHPVTAVNAMHNCNSAKSASSSLTGGLESILYLCIGARVMLRSNLWTEKGLVNGSLGYVRAILFSPQEINSPSSILVEFDEYTGPTVGNNLVPIPKISVSWKVGTNELTRKQFPLQLAYAVTIHKS